MLDNKMELDREEYLAGLVLPDDYNRHLNQVIGVTSKNIIFLKSKYFSKAGFEIIKFPVHSCVSITHKDERSIITVTVGILLTALIVFIFYLLINYRVALAGASIPIILLILVLFGGLRWVFGSRKQKLIFLLLDKTKLQWISRLGEYNLHSSSVEIILNYAEKMGLLKNQHEK